MSEDTFPAAMKVPPNLVGIRKVRTTNEGYLVFEVAGQTLGPPQLMTDVRKPFDVFWWGAEGVGARTRAAFEAGTITFTRDESFLDADGESWIQTRSHSDDFEAFLDHLRIHYDCCLYLHPLVAPTVLLHVMRCAELELIRRPIEDRRNNGLEGPLMALARMVSLALEPAVPGIELADDFEGPMANGLRELCATCGLSRRLPHWVGAVRASLRGVTENFPV